MAKTLRVPARQPTSVGMVLKEEFLAPLGISQGQLAKAMGVSRKTVNELCGNRRGVTAETRSCFQRYWALLRNSGLTCRL